MKKVILLASFLLFSASLAFAQVQIQSGTFSESYTSKGYTLDKGTGERTYLVEVNFPAPFDKKPKIVLSVSNIDADGQFNTRYKVEAFSVGRDNFTIKISTWGDSKIFGIGGGWIAFGG
ncbi:MAG TPA: H-type lectin domain-containing protein [Ignavibacteriaceae bacterium]|nr:H-type lectin domain-containing protein [Ignavibacteriaceae bacterium]